MAKSSNPASRYAGDFRNDRLNVLVARIAAGDRAAFRIVYAFLVMGVWRDAIRLLPPVDARAVTRSTFVEIWHLAGHHLDQDRHQTYAWILSINARHVEERARSVGVQPLHCDGYDNHTHRELIALLGTGKATIRTAPATFTRVVDLAP
ncbi:hypothetical protein K1W54_02500 [Micromonospora sp. CPCC 205371]|nr:hypothetical protein [Micromonospora sp. CPCC 205371]